MGARDVRVPVELCPAEWVALPYLWIFARYFRAPRYKWERTWKCTGDITIRRRFMLV